MRCVDLKKAETAVIIPNFNGLGFLDDCLKALSTQSYKDFRVIVVDNGSSDGSREYLEGMDRVETVFLDKNYGFSAAVNRGIKEAGDVSFIVLLNNDTVPEKDYLLSLIAPLKDPESEIIGAVTPLMLKLSDPEIIDDAGDGYNILGWSFQRGVGHRASSPLFSKKAFVSSACAGACCYKKKALDTITCPGGVFDEGHFAYLEDIDVSIRLRLSGYRILYEPSSRVRHVGSGTSGSRYNDFKVFLAARNNIFLIYKNYPLLMIFINLPFLILGTLIKTVFFIKKGFGASYTRGLKEGFRGIKDLRERKIRFRVGRIARYIELECCLIKDMFSYTGDFLLRKAGH